MKTSSQRTTAAAMRVIIKIKHDEMAGLLGCSPFTIHSIESGRRKLSKELAMRMSLETGIAAEWLLAGNPKAPPISSKGGPYSQEVFERTRAERAQLDKAGEHWKMFDALDLTARMVAILLNAGTRGRYPLARYKAYKMMDRLREEFGQAESLYAPVTPGSCHTGESLAILEKMRKGCKKATAQLGAIFKRSAKGKPSVTVEVNGFKFTFRKAPGMGGVY